MDLPSSKTPPLKAVHESSGKTIDIQGKIDWLMADTTCLVCLICTVSGRCKKGKCLGRCGASSRHTTKLKQSIFFRYLWIAQWFIFLTKLNFSYGVLIFLWNCWCYYNGFYSYTGLFCYTLMYFLTQWFYFIAHQFIFLHSGLFS